MTTYVVQGVLFLLLHPGLWCHFLSSLMCSLLLTLGAVLGLFLMGFSPQFRYLHTSCSIPALFAWLLTLLLVLVEGCVMTLVLSLVLLAKATNQLFEQVLRLRGHDKLLDEGNPTGSTVAEVVVCLSGCANCCRVSVVLRLLLLVVTIPLHLIPVVGSILWLALNGIVLAWDYHLSYFELKHWGFARQRELVTSRTIQYTSFGMQALALEMLPVVGMVFGLTNTVGAALFAADMEDDECAIGRISSSSSLYHHKAELAVV